MTKGLYYACTAVALAAAAAGTAEAQGPRSVRIRQLDYAGTGCRAGSVAENVSDDSQAFTLLFDSYVAATGPGTPFVDKRKNCAISVTLDYPRGWSFALVDVDYRGYVDLEPGVTATHAASYYFQGDGRTGQINETLRGPVSDIYHVRHTIAAQPTVWSPCGAPRALMINSSLRVDNARNPRGYGLIANDTIDGATRHVYNLRWRRC